jgi:phosphomannomutase
MRNGALVAPCTRDKIFAMGRKFFGTDGIRGRTNAGVMTAATAMKVGQAAGTYFQRGDHRHRVVIGKDTRLSGYMLENAMTAGFTSVGMDVVLLGPLPTPAVAMLTREMRADVGVMISASHNPFEDNGIKLFGPDGFKLSDEDELAIEALLERSWAWHRPVTWAAPAASRMRAAAISTRSRPRCRTTCASTGCASWSIAPMARPIPWPLRRCGNWARK